MKRLDALVLKELIGPWIFGVSMFTMLFIAATYLGRIAKYFTEGVPPGEIVHLTLLFLPAVMVKTFAMALLLGGLLSFGRLSGDSEITAIRAAGVSLYRIVLPVAIFSLVVAAIAFTMNEQMVPGAAKQSTAIMIDIARNSENKAEQPVKHIEVHGGKVVAMFGAKDFSLETRTLRGVHVVAYDKSGRESFVMFADALSFTDLQDWKILGNAEVLNRDGSYHVKIEPDAEGKTIWPENIPKIASSPEDILASDVKDLDLFSMKEIQDQIRKGRESGNMTETTIRNFEFGYWNKIALPLAAFIFGTLGATLGIRNHRTGSATGFAISIAIIFSYFTLINFMNVYAGSGLFPPYVASFTPIAIGLIASGVIIWRRNR